MFSITAVGGPRKGTFWIIRNGTLVVGRSDQSEICLDDVLVSRRHCQITVDGDTLRVVDLQSANGTFVNGQVVSESELRAGDEVAIGSSVLQVSLANQIYAFGSAIGVDSSTDAVLDIPRGGNGVGTKEGRQDGEFKTVLDYVDLAVLSRELGKAARLDDLVAILASSAALRFRVEALWFARYHDDSRRFTVFGSCDGSELRHRDQYVSMMEESLSEQQPALLRSVTPAGSGEVSTVMAPMTAGGVRMGLLVAQTPDPCGEEVLRLFGIVANHIAPMFHLVEQIERFRRETDWLRASAGQSTAFLGESKSIKRVRGLIRTVAPSNISVLVTGETGTGKEIVARRIHELSVRSNSPFVVMNCAAIPVSLFESELFGFEKGAFSGADQQKAGRLEQADGGTLFLDEVGDLSVENQARILRAIEQRTFYRVGGLREITVDIRIISATNRDLPSLIRSGAFREDLYHRLATFQIVLSPLRERPSDIPLLANHFLRLSGEMDRSPNTEFTPDALEYLQSRAWNGNVRELRNVISCAVLRTASGTIGVAEICDSGRQSFSGPESTVRFRSLAEIEKAHITEVLRECGGNVSAAARLLEIHRTTLHRKVVEYGIEA